MNKKNTDDTDTPPTQQTDKASHGKTGAETDFNMLEDLDMNDIEER